MGVVYRARQEPLGRPVALKVLADAVAADGVVMQRFEKEAQAVARLNHPNIVVVYEFGRTGDGLMFLAMELLEGESLFARLRRGPAEPEEAVDVVTQVARALAEAHAHGVVHRDLKPENVMLLTGRDGERVVKVLDFGLAKMTGAQDKGGAPLTSASVIMGTPGYMSPEQIHARPLDARTDLYALGMVWWELIVGHPPFAGDTPIELLVKHLQQELPRPTSVRPTLRMSAREEALIMRLGAKDPNDRPLDGASLLGELRGLKEDGWTVAAKNTALAGTSAEWDLAFQGLDAAAPGEHRTESLRPDEIPSSRPHPVAPGPPAPTAAPPAPPARATAQLGTPASPPPSAKAGGNLQPTLILRDAIETIESMPAQLAPPQPTWGTAPSMEPVAREPPPPVVEPPRPPANFWDNPEDAAPPPSKLEPNFDFPPPRAPPPAAVRVPDPFGGTEYLQLSRPKTKITGPQQPFPEEPKKEQPEVKWQVRSGGAVQGPLSFTDLLKLVRAGTVRSTDDAAPVGEPFRPVSSYPLLQRELAAKKGAPLTGRAAGAKAEPLYRRVGLVLLLFAVAAIVGVSYGLFPAPVNEGVGSVVSGVFRLGAAAGVDVGPHPLRSHFDSWRSELGAPEQGALELYAEGKERLKLETVTARFEADAAFRRGLLVEPDQPLLLAAFAENRAWLRAMGHAVPTDVPLEAVAAYATTRKEGGERVEVVRAEGAVAALGGNSEKAISMLTKARKLDGSDVDTAALLALAALDDPATAQEHAAAALKLGQGATRVELIAGIVARRAGDFHDAVQHLERRAKAEPRDALAARELALALLDVGEERRAMKALEAAYAESGDLATAALHAKLLLRTRAGEGKADSLLAESSKQAYLHKHGAELLELRTRLLLRRGGAAQALVVAEDAVRRFEGHAGLRAALARAYEANGRLVEARKALTVAESLAPPRDVPRLLQERGDLELRAGQHAEAADAYAKSLGVAPGRAGPRLGLVVSYFARGAADEARRQLLGLMALDPRQERDRDRTTEPFAAEPFVLYAQRMAAIEKVERSAAALIAKGVTAFFAGDLDVAKRALAAGIAKDPSHPVANLYLAVIELEQEQHRSAHRRLSLLEAADPDEKMTQLYLARIEAPDKPQSAETRLGRLAADTSLTVEVNALLGDVEAAKGRREKADYHYRVAFTRDGRYLPAKRALLLGLEPVE